MEKPNSQLIIISDLHLSEGWNPKTRRLSRNEDFFFDLNFQRFLEHLTEKAEETGFHYRLVINGDFVDFLQFISVPEEAEIGDGESVTEREKELGLGTSIPKTLWKLNVLINGHWIFFDALKEFILRENEVIIVPGNHDIEWVVPAVQEKFKERLSATIPGKNKSEFRKRIQFSPWFYYDPHFSVYAEHGCQYDELNSFDYFLCPYRKDGTMDLPAGSFFVRYLFNRIEQYYPFADNMKPMSKFIWWALRRRETWFSVRPRILKFIRFFLDTMEKAGSIEEEWRHMLERCHEKMLESLANNSGLCISKLQALEKLWVSSALHTKSKWGLLNKFARNSKLDGKYYFKRAEKIREILGGSYVVFGHTHEADLQVFTEVPDGQKAEYVNSGTWTKTFAANYEEALLKSENEFVYVHFKVSEKNDIKMELLRWNDSIKKGERVKLFEDA